jgi:hypothetical protein
MKGKKVPKWKQKMQQDEQAEKNANHDLLMKSKPSREGEGDVNGKLKTDLDFEGKQFSV